MFGLLSRTGLTPNVDVTVGDICCPIGTQLEDNDDLVSSITYTVITKTFDILGLDLIDNRFVNNLLSRLGIQQGTLNCVANINLLSAEPVVDPYNDNFNVLDRFTPPFTINLPTNNNADDEWLYVAPDGEGINTGL